MIKYRWTKRKDIIIVRIIDTDDPELESKCGVYKISYKEFRECEKILKALGYKNPKDEALLNLALYGKCD